MAPTKLGKGFAYLFGGIIAFMLFFIALTWYAIRNVSEDWSQEARYTNIIGKSFHLTSKTYLIRQYERDYYKEGFRMDTDSSLADSTSLVFLPGTELTFSSVEYLKRGVSGVEYIYLLGTIKDAKGISIPFEFIWATPLFYHENESDKWKYRGTFWN